VPYPKVPQQPSDSESTNVLAALVALWLRLEPSLASQLRSWRWRRQPRPHRCRLPMRVVSRVATWPFEAPAKLHLLASIAPTRAQGPCDAPVGAVISSRDRACLGRGGDWGDVALWISEAIWGARGDGIDSACDSHCSAVARLWLAAVGGSMREWACPWSMVASHKIGMDSHRTRSTVDQSI